MRHRSASRPLLLFVFFDTDLNVVMSPLISSVLGTSEVESAAIIGGF